jgi:hypothetical protein
MYAECKCVKVFFRIYSCLGPDTCDTFDVAVDRIWLKQMTIEYNYPTGKPDCILQPQFG